MSEELRQPRTFWQWLTSQPGTIYSPPPPPQPRPARTALDFIESELCRVHEQIENFRDDDSFGENESIIAGLIARLDKLHDELSKRSSVESTNGTDNK